MKNRLFHLVIAASLLAVARTSPATTLLTDNFTVDANSGNPNFEIGNGRQGGIDATSPYTTWGPQTQVGNTATDVGQPGQPLNGNYLLLADYSGAQNNLDVATATGATGPLIVSFDMYFHTGGNPGGGDPTYWGAFSLQNNSVAPASDPFPVVGAGQFGFLDEDAPP